MRADRLLSILMLLQARGRVTAQHLAEELEVSVRTIYRDIDALSAAGVPVYAERGPGGGCALVEGYRTSLTGLTTDEVKALFMLSVPASLDELGMSQELRTALRKLAAALPDDQRQDEIRVRQRIHLDWSDWSRGEEATPHLQTIHRAVWEDRRLHLAHREFVGPQGFERFERLVDPYGLVAKAGRWYLVCAGEERLRVYRVSRILDAHITDEHFERPPDFDLTAFWELWCTGREESRPAYSVTVRVSPGLAVFLPLHFGDRIREAIAQAELPDDKGWITLTLPFETFEEARGRILGFGKAVEVIEPEPLRLSVIDFARQIVEFYSG
ncbi:MAG: YafY family transcriptional regulator [Anaerolineae bacterium]|nr:YafY family transcriptional regulator [Anaerolineae bacterium]